MMADIGDMVIYSYGCSPVGNQKVVMSIGSKAEDPERLAAFVDWLYSPEGIRNNRAQTSGGMAGPEGLCWEYGEDGPYLTDFGKKALLGEDVEVPEEWGKGTWSEGISALNYSTVASCELDEKGYPYAYLLWDSVRNMNISPLEIDWREKWGQKQPWNICRKTIRSLFLRVPAIWLPRKILRWLLSGGSAGRLFRNIPGIWYLPQMRRNSTVCMNKCARK